MRNFLVFVLVSVTLLTACQSVSPEAAKSEFCANLQTYHAAVANLAALSPDSTVDQAQEAVKAVSDARDDVASSAYILADAKAETLDESYDNLQSAVRDISSSDTMSDAITSIQDEVAAVNAAYDDVFAANCK